MEQSISEASRGKNGNGQAKFVAFLEKPQENGIEEEVHQQFFEVGVETVEKFGDGTRGKRSVRVPQCVEPSHSAYRDDAVTTIGVQHDDLEKAGNETRPANVPGSWSAAYTQRHRL